MKLYITAIIISTFIALFALYKLLGVDKVRSWLLWGVTTAEREFGAGTGKLKLALVYDLFIDKFPMLQAIIPYALFSKLVDLALVEMREMLKNEKITSFITGETE